ncbi:MAG: metal-dependent hydrolase [Kiritimatiellia bacterium]|nr:metal-dependent hydrolase [Lentisphaerota bacterium]
MPSPLAHIAVGCAIGDSAGRRSPHYWRILAISVFFAMLPDIDAIPGILFRNIGKYHNQFTHSIFFGLAICLLATPLVRLLLPEHSPKRIFGLLAACSGSHLLLDFFTHGGTGRLLFWPFHTSRFRAPLTIFNGLRWSAGLISPAHLATLANESVFVLALYLIIYLIREHNSREQGGGPDQGDTDIRISQSR